MAGGYAAVMKGLMLPQQQLGFLLLTRNFVAKEVLQVGLPSRSGLMGFRKHVYVLWITAQQDGIFYATC